MPSPAWPAARPVLPRTASNSSRSTGDRRTPTPAVADRDWDLVVEISWQPGLVRGALAALAPRAAAWAMVSSVSVYAENGTPGADESDAVLPAFEGDVAEISAYGEAKVACEAATAEATGGAGGARPRRPDRRGR